LFGHALNATGNPAVPHRYNDAAQRRFTELGIAFVELIEEGEIIGAMEQDAGFQRFMASAVIPRILPKTKNN
jgi:hypothetical protein